MSPDAMLAGFMQHLRVERGLSPCTWTSYGYQIRGYLRFLVGRGKTPATATRDHVMAYLEARRDARLASSSLFAAAIAIRQFHRFLAERGHAKADPTIGMKLPKFKQRLPEPLSVQEMARLLDAPVDGKFNHVRNNAMLELMYATGMRVSELLRITLDKVNLEGCCVRICGKGGKDRIVPFGKKANAAILRYLVARNQRLPIAQATLFVNSRGQPINRGTFWWELRRMAGRAGLHGRITPHQIRHSAATHLLEGGADLRVLQEMLGHCQITTTQRYTHVTAEFLKATCGKAHPRF
ncbi:MAG: tyrosine recombinase [Elusimicrobia bacterium]|nr:tyrosine recombinase [Elusimicrobiota bacterium]